MHARPYRSPFPALLPLGGHLRFLDPVTGERRAVYLDEKLTRPVIEAVPLGEGGVAPLVWLPGTRAYRVELASDHGTTVAAHHAAPGGHPAGAPDDAGLFAHLADLRLPPSVSRVRTEGWGRAGLGAGDYVSDAKATPELAAAHPRFCVRLKDGRCFRLAESAGLVTVEQGGALGDPSGQNRQDDRAAIQATIDYAQAAGIARIGFAQARYSIWATRRTTQKVEFHATDGHALVLGPGQPVHFVGLGPQRAHMVFRRTGGRSFEGDKVGEAFEIVGGKVWRGCGFFLPGNGPINFRTAHDGRDRSGLIFEHLLIDGGTRKTDFFGWPARVSDGRGWDTTHKGICAEPDKAGRDITIRDCEMTGWRGETVFTTNDFQSRLIVRNSRFTQSNGQGLNPNGCNLDVENCLIADCYIGIEGWTGVAGGRIVATTIQRCYGLPNRTSGGAFYLDGGCYDTRKVVTGAPMPDFARNPPWGALDISCEDCGTGYIGSKLKGRVRLDRTLVRVGAGGAFNYGSQDVAMTFIIADRPDPQRFSRVMVSGGTNKAGSRYTDRIDLTIQAGQGGPAGARLGGGHGDSPFVWYGSLGANIRAHVKGLRSRAAPQPIGPVTDDTPHVTVE